MRIFKKYQHAHVWHPHVWIHENSEIYACGCMRCNVRFTFANVESTFANIWNAIINPYVWTSGSEYSFHFYEYMELSMPSTFAKKWILCVWICGMEWYVYVCEFIKFSHPTWEIQCDVRIHECLECWYLSVWIYERCWHPYVWICRME